MLNISMSRKWRRGSLITFDFLTTNKSLMKVKSNLLFEVMNLPSAICIKSAPKSLRRETINSILADLYGSSAVLSRYDSSLKSISSPNILIILECNRVVFDLGLLFGFVVSPEVFQFTVEGWRFQCYD